MGPVHVAEGGFRVFPPAQAGGLEPRAAGGLAPRRIHEHRVGPTPEARRGGRLAGPERRDDPRRGTREGRGDQDATKLAGTADVHHVGRAVAGERPTQVQEPIGGREAGEHAGYARDHAGNIDTAWQARDRPPILPGMSRELPDALADDWTFHRDGSVTALVRDDFLDRFRRLGLIEAADRPPADLAPGARPFRPDGGRGELAVLPAGPDGEVVVRPYRRGGLAARFLDRTYLLGDRAFDEVVVTERLRRRGVPTVRPLAGVQSAARTGYRAALVTRRVAGAHPAPALLSERRGDELRSVLRRMGRSTGRLHGAGGVHVDLNAHNFLLPRGGGDAVLLDFDRARLLGRDPLGFFAGQNVRRLRRHLEKLELQSALDAWDAFEEGYDEAVEAAGS